MRASLVGLGLARFAYTPLIPALIAAKWFTPAEAVYLGAANLAGYLAGALIARDLGARIGQVWALRGTMVLAAITCFACAVPISFIWFFGFRLLAGAGGGVIMVLAATAILPHTAPSKRGLVGGVIFAGVGLGIAASGTLVPLLLQQGVKQAWYGPRRAVGGADAAELEGVAGRGACRARGGTARRGAWRALAAGDRVVPRIRPQRAGARAAHGVPGRLRGARARAGDRRRIALLGAVRPRRRRGSAAVRDISPTVRVLPRRCGSAFLIEAVAVAIPARERIACRADRPRASSSVVSRPASCRW